jgi:signal transduction histidine kinase
MDIARLRRGLLGSPARADVLIVVALIALGVASQLTLVVPAAAPTRFVPSPPLLVAWSIAFTGPLLLRRRFPCTVLAVTAVHFVFYWPVGMLNEIASWLVLGVVVFSAAAYGRLPRAAWCAGACTAVMIGLGFLALALAPGSGTGRFGAPGLAVATVLNALPYLLGWTLGTMTRRLRENRTALRERTRELEDERRRSAERAVLEERVRIARELHDVVAHHVSLMGIQAGVAHRLFDARPDEARAAVADVQSGSRQVIAELQALLAVLRSGEDAENADTEPTPGLDRLPELVAGVRRAGLPVELAVEGAPGPPALELSAYRIVQEALTNSLKHAGTARASVTVRCAGRAIDVEVLDDGRGSAAGREGAGRGLVGMRERVGLHGGTLEAGARPGGGFRVHARLVEP